MASRYATTQYNRLHRVKSAITDIYARARAYHFSSDKITALQADVWTLPDYRKLPAYERGYLRGVADMLRDDIWRNHVIWMLGPESGPTRQVHSEWTEEMSTLCRLPGQLYGGHYWLDATGKPTSDVFTEYKPTN